MMASRLDEDRRRGGVQDVEVAAEDDEGAMALTVGEEPV